MTSLVHLFPDTYVDSVVQLRGLRAMREVPGVQWASALMATPANVEALQADGADPGPLGGAGANDFCLAVRADSEECAKQAIDAGAAAIFARREPSATEPKQRSRSVREAVAAQPDSTVAVISVPGEYAALAAFQALGAGLHVLLFSDNVPVEKEIALKSYARSRGLLLMGPGAGTAMLAGTSLGFANVVAPGRVGVVAAAGTGAQEAMCLLDRWGVGVSQVIGLGGRDLSEQVGGRMAQSAVAALRDDPDTDAILLVSKPPSTEVALAVLDRAGRTPIVAALIGIDPADVPVPAGVTLTRTLETGVAATLAKLGRGAPDTTTLLGPRVDQARSRLVPDRSLVRGLFSGGTLCYESLVILGDVLGPVYSNTPVDPAWRLPAPQGSHQCLDLGEEEFTRGRPHPMIDAEARIDVLHEHAADEQVASVILDVVLGYGAHPDPASVLAPVCAQIMSSGGPQIVAYVLGTEQDPQHLGAQRAALAEAGCIVTETAARASLTAAAVATGNVDLVSARL
jgi:FdrA protein